MNITSNKNGAIATENLNELNKEAWNAYQEDYFKFNLMERPDYFEFFAGGGVDRNEIPCASMLGDVKGLKLLDTCCACDAVQAFSWHNLGAVVTACDITPKAIEIASASAAKMNLAVEFVVADMQTLEPVGDGQFDIVYATYPVWVQDIAQACKTWHRVLKPGGRLLWHMEHPITYCVAEEADGLRMTKSYNAPSTVLYDCFEGTPMADRHAGGWSVDLPSAEHFWRISDILNAICGAGFRIMQVHETHEPTNQLPCEFAVLAVK